MKNSIPPEIVVISGEQAGARARLDNNSTVTLSGKSDTDIVIRDPSIDGEMIKIVTQDNRVALEVVSGSIEVENTIIEQGKRAKLSEYAKVKIGETVFIHTREPHATWDEIRNLAVINSDKNSSESSTIASNKFSKNIFLSLTALFVILTVSVGVVTATMSRSNLISMSNLENIHSLLIENGFESLQVKRESDENFVIHGFLMKNKERAMLEKLVDEYSVPARLELEVGDQLAMEVREIYRVNGIDVLTQASSAGKVTVKVKSQNISKLEKIKSMALEEITNLQDLEIVYVKNSEESQLIGIDFAYNAADKRITMVVDGDPAYIMTSDESKYYIGALLPTGYKIVDIVDQQVVLEKHGKQKTLNF
jgi:type III secretion protein D